MKKKRKQPDTTTNAPSEAAQKVIFQGFATPTRNYFPMPNEWINICAEITNLAELKVVQYVLRHTWGYHEYDGTPKVITTDEFMHGRKYADTTRGRIDKGTGLSKQSVIDGLKRAVDHGFLICDTDDSDLARIEKSYALKMVPTSSDVKDLDIKNRGLDSRHRVSKTLTSDVNNLDSDCLNSRHRSEKDTKERPFRKTRGKNTASSRTSQKEKQSSPPSSFSPSSPLEQTTKKEEAPSLPPSELVVVPPPMDETPLTTTEEVYQAYDSALKACHIVNDDYKQTPRTTSNTEQMKSLLDQGATRKGISDAMGSLATDPDTFYRKNIKPKFFSENYAARLGIVAQAQRQIRPAGTKTHKERVLEEHRTQWNKWMTPTTASSP